MLWMKGSGLKEPPKHWDEELRQTPLVQMIFHLDWSRNEPRLLVIIALALLEGIMAELVRAKCKQQGRRLGECSNAMKAAILHELGVIVDHELRSSTRS